MSWYSIKIQPMVVQVKFAKKSSFTRSTKRTRSHLGNQIPDEFEPGKRNVSSRGRPSTYPHRAQKITSRENLVHNVRNPLAKRLYITGVSRSLAGVFRPLPLS